jgi:hypothetical protein
MSPASWEMLGANRARSLTTKATSYTMETVVSHRGLLVAFGLAAFGEVLSFSCEGGIEHEGIPLWDVGRCCSARCSLAGALPAGRKLDPASSEANSEKEKLVGA